MSEPEKIIKSWEELIKEYIDGLGDEDKNTAYLDEIIANFYFQKICNPRNEIENKSKGLKKELEKVKKIPRTAKNKTKLQNIYQQFVKNEWITNEQAFFDFLIKKQNFYNIWINRATFSDEGILPATHVAKITHSSNSATSILDDSQSNKHGYLTTSSMRNKIIDGAYPDAKFSKIVKFFMLTFEGKILGNEILSGKTEILKSFSESEQELFYWLATFKKIIRPKPKADRLIKQTYFPVKESYHLNIVLSSSALQHEFFLKNLEKSVRNKKEKTLSKLRKRKFSSEYFHDIYGLARILPTQSQPQNVSVLNGSRGGLTRLVSNQPPTWQAQTKPPIYKKSLFSDIHNSTISTEIDYLRDFLVRFKKLDISIKDPKRKQHLDRWINNIIDEVLFYVGTIQNLPSGWTKNESIKLKKSHQYLLDPYRLDDDFQSDRRTKDWQTICCTDFAQWLNYRLRGKDQIFTPQTEHTRLWKKMLEQPLREYMEPIEENIKQTMRETV